MQKTDPKSAAYPSRSADLYAQAFDWADRDAIEGAFAVNAAYNAHVAAMSRLSAALGINRTVGRHALIRLLHFAENHRLTQFEIAAELQVTSSNVTFLVDGLENAGMVRRVPHPTDRRTVHVELTGEGEALGAMLVPAMARFMAAMFKGFDETEKRTFVELLERFRVNAETFDPAAMP